MKLMKSFIVVMAGLTLLVSGTAAVAQEYDFTFTGNSGIDATGTIDITGGVATSGSINVINVPLEAPNSGMTTAAGDLLPGSSAINGVAKNHDGDQIGYDNSVNLANNPILTSDGIAFVSGQYAPNYYNTLVNLWGNSPGSYSMFIGEANPAYLEPDGTLDPETPHSDVQWVYVYDETGTMTITPVPEPTTAGCFLLGLGVLALTRRFKQNRHN